MTLLCSEKSFLGRRTSEGEGAACFDHLSYGLISISGDLHSAAHRFCEWWLCVDGVSGPSARYIDIKENFRWDNPLLVRDLDDSHPQLGRWTSRKSGLYTTADEWILTEFDLNAGSASCRRTARSPAEQPRWAQQLITSSDLLCWSKCRNVGLCKITKICKTHTLLRSDIDENVILKWINRCPACSFISMKLALDL